MPKCLRCNQNDAVNDPELGVLPCATCQDNDSRVQFVKNPEFISITKQDRINSQRDTHAKDMIQPWTGKDWKPNPEFAKAYPNQAKDYFTKEQLKDL